VCTWQELSRLGRSASPSESSENNNSLARSSGLLTLTEAFSPAGAVTGRSWGLNQRCVRESCVLWIHSVWCTCCRTRDFRAGVARFCRTGPSPLDLRAALAASIPSGTSGAPGVRAGSCAPVPSNRHKLKYFRGMRIKFRDYLVKPEGPASAGPTWSNQGDPQVQWRPSPPTAHAHRRRVGIRSRSAFEKRIAYCSRCPSSYVPGLRLPSCMR
jgi:hypothetical protein